jgi:hypothetical protein
MKMCGNFHILATLYKKGIQYSLDRRLGIVESLWTSQYAEGFLLLLVTELQTSNQPTATHFTG